MATRLQVVEAAFRLLGMKAEDQALSADELAYGGDTLDQLLEEAGESVELGFDSSDVPAPVVPAVARLLAAEIAPSYGRHAPVPRPMAFVRLMALVRPSTAPASDPVFY